MATKVIHHQRRNGPRLLLLLLERLEKLRIYESWRKLRNRLAPLTLVTNLATRWPHMLQLKIWWWWWWWLWRWQWEWQWWWYWWWGESLKAQSETIHELLIHFSHKITTFTFLLLVMKSDDDRDNDHRSSDHWYHINSILNFLQLLGNYLKKLQKIIWVINDNAVSLKCICQAFQFFSKLRITQHNSWVK